MRRTLVDALSDMAVRNAKPALRDGVPVDRKCTTGEACICWSEATAPSIGALSTTSPAASDGGPWASTSMSP